MWQTCCMSGVIPPVSIPAGCAVHHRVKLHRAESEPARLQHPGVAGIYCVRGQNHRDEFVQCRRVQVSRHKKTQEHRVSCSCSNLLSFFSVSGGCSKAVLWLGQLRLSCSEEQLLALIGLLTHSLAFGPISSWGTDVFIEIGVLAGMVHWRTGSQYHCIRRIFILCL